MPVQPATWRPLKCCLILCAVLVGTAVGGGITGIGIAMYFAIPIVVFLAYVGLATTILILTLLLVARWRATGAPENSGTPGTPSKAGLITWGFAWLLVPGVLLSALGAGVLFGPSLHSRVFYDPPRMGETAEELRHRLGPPVIDNLIGNKGGFSRKLGYQAPDGKRYFLTLNDGVVIDIKTEYR